MIPHSVFRCRGACRAAALGAAVTLAQAAFAQSPQPGPRPTPTLGFDTSSFATAKPLTPRIITGGAQGPRGSNDACAAATPISGSGAVPFSTANASNDGGASCGATAASPDVWFVYTAEAQGDALFNTCSEGAFDTVISALTDCGGAELACNDDFCGLQSQISVSVVPGSRIFIRVSGFNGDRGDGVLTFVGPGQPPGTVGCPAGGGRESAGGGGAARGGCNAAPPVYQVIGCNSHICGTAWGDNTVRDTDWYEFTTTAATTTVNLTLSAEIPLVCFLLDNACPPNLIAAFDAPTCGASGAVSQAVPAGTYHIFVGTGTLGGGIFAGFPCSTFRQYALGGDFGVPCRLPPVITNFTPAAFGRGDLVTVNGRNFGFVAGDICMVAKRGNLLFPFEVLQADDTRILARMTDVAPDAVGPAELRVMLGDGDFGPFIPAFRDVILDHADETWIWTGGDLPAAIAPQPAILVSRPPPPRMTYNYGTIVDGQLCLTLAGDWPVNKAMVLENRLHGVGPGGAFRFHDFKTWLTFRWGGSAEDCAWRICDALHCAFGQHNPAIPVNCTVTQDSSGHWKITVGIPGGVIECGTFRICMTEPLVGVIDPGLPVSAFGAAALTQAPVGVLASNFGPAGHDGFSIDLGRENTRGFIADVDPIDIDVPARCLRLDAWGGWNDFNCYHLGNGGLWGRPESCLDAFADFSDIQSDTVRVEVFMNDQFVGRAVRPNGVVGVVQGFPNVPRVIGCGKLPPVVGPLNPPCFIINFDNPFIFTAVDGVPMTGNSLRLLADDASAPISTLGLLDVTPINPAGVPPLEIHVLGGRFTGGPAPCPCDWNHTGNINSQDFFDFISDFFSGTADFNNDNFVNSQDFFDFLNCFFQPPPACG